MLKDEGHSAPHPSRPRDLVHFSPWNHTGGSARLERKMLNSVSLKIALKHEIWHTVVLHFSLVVGGGKWASFLMVTVVQRSLLEKINGRACSWSGNLCKESFNRMDALDKIYSLRTIRRCIPCGKCRGRAGGRWCPPVSAPPGRWHTRPHPSSGRPRCM